MRPELLNPLFAEIEVLKGIGPAIAKPLAKLGLSRIVDLLFHLPTGLVHRQRVARLDDAVEGTIISVEVTPTEYRQSGVRGPFRVLAVDRDGDVLALTYFGGGGGYARKQLPLGVKKLVSGKLELYGQERQIVHPDYVIALEDGQQLPENEAIYPLSEGITSRRMGQLVAQAMPRAPDLAEWIEPSLLEKRGWPGWLAALKDIHQRPANSLARDRLAYDELFANQLALMLVRASSRRRRGMPLSGDGHLRDKLTLLYVLTGAQRRTIAEIEGDMAQQTPMVRLLQGDVGSGKTLVALHALLIAAECGAQGAMLAPTEILARQHYETLRAQLAGLPVNVAILTGRDKGRAREATLMGLADGSITSSWALMPFFRKQFRTRSSLSPLSMNSTGSASRNDFCSRKRQSCRRTCSS